MSLYDSFGISGDEPIEADMEQIEVPRKTRRTFWFLCTFYFLNCMERGLYLCTLRIDMEILDINHSDECVENSKCDGQQFIRTNDQTYLLPPIQFQASFLLVLEA